MLVDAIAQIEQIKRDATVRHGLLMEMLDAFRDEMRAEFASLKADYRLEITRQVSSISERVAVMESRTKRG